MFQSGRSTKGASKQRRDCINVEIQHIRDLLPVSDVIRQRLSQLQVMSLCNAFIAKSNVFDMSLNRPDSRSTDFIDLFDFSQALPGFLLMISLDGKILYLSENISEYLGHSMVEMITQADTIYDIVDAQDSRLFTEILSAAASCDVSLLDTLNFTCRMNIPRRRQPGYDRQKTMQVHGRLMMPRDAVTSQRDGVTSQQAVFIASCTPHLSVYTTFQSPTVLLNTMIFTSEHSMDMKFTDIDDKGMIHLGYNCSDIRNKSWYDMVHPIHLDELKAKHLQVAHGTRDIVRALCARVQTHAGHMIWLHIVIHLNTDDDNIPHIICINHVIDEDEVAQTQSRDQMDEDLMEGQTESLHDIYLPTVVSEEGFRPAIQSNLTSEVKKRLKRKLESGASHATQPAKPLLEADSTSSESDWLGSPLDSETLEMPLMPHLEYSHLSSKARNNMTSPAFQMFDQPVVPRSFNAPNIKQSSHQMSHHLKLEDHFNDGSFCPLAEVDHKKIKLTKPVQPSLPELDQVVIEDFFTQVASPPQFHGHSTDTKTLFDPIYEILPELGDTHTSDGAAIFETIFDSFELTHPNIDNLSTMGELFYDNIERFPTFNGLAPSAGRLVLV